ncbi:hypothetical protein BK138_26810 [Paenibacillus rhizosphaerae]|uniref:Copper amine oxidase-like N-terminal domain-containing protein n=1 Tax=Paenibacillus rhizosphaerae TaxID=297318 RepID=A0A1R1EFL7_9BACL|nr:copper amine oxidase N-terminal domain-containing protein [Paenibacillus rhizosphaerae]OMF50610.1 hypothetical protein BK138_26810 [Paenibacillus rhizosphaerae]
MKRRSFLSLAVLTVCILVFGAQAVFASAGPDSRGVYRPTIYINGDKQTLTAAIPPSGSTLVPFRAFFSALMMDAQFDNQTKTVTAKNNDTTVTLTAGKKIATLNGREVQLLQGPELVDDGLMYVNLRFIAEAFGGKVQFDKTNLTIQIDFQNK